MFPHNKIKLIIYDFEKIKKIKVIKIKYLALLFVLL